VYTIIETPVYARKAAQFLDDAGRESVAAFLALNPLAGVVIRGSGGVRKLRWRTDHGGKRGGHRIVYFNQLERGHIWLLTIFSKRQLDNISTRELVQIRKVIDDDN